jgi:DNA polymerase I-like protein with 3'-5' exonuclease and polymerase domains
MRCVHCDRLIRHREELFVYPLSQLSAHHSCVSQPSVAEVDRYLVEQKNKPTRRVYTSVGTGRVSSTAPNRSNVPREG